MSGYTDDDIKCFELSLKQFGNVEDVSCYNQEDVKKIVQKSLGLYLDPYNDSTDALIDIEILKDRTIQVNKSSLAFAIYNSTEKSFLINIVKDSSFKLEIPMPEILIPQAHLSAEATNFENAILLVRELTEITKAFVDCFGGADNRHKKFSEERELSK